MPDLDPRCAPQLAAVTLAVESGRITRIYAVNNPRKLARLGGVVAIARC